MEAALQGLSCPIERYTEETLAEQALCIADTALEAYLKRWPDLKLED